MSNKTLATIVSALLGIAGVFVILKIIDIDRKDVERKKQIEISEKKERVIQEELREKYGTIDKWEIADVQTKRLSPKEFKILPKAISNNLIKRGCTIPQIFPSYDKPHNVIKGEFSKPGQTDYAVLCSINRVSSIIIFWDGAIDNTSLIAKSTDSGYLQGIGGGKIGFSREIYSVSIKQINNYHDNCKEVKAEYGVDLDCSIPSSIDHQGIGDAFVNKGSGILYFHDGEFLTFSSLH